MRDVFSYTFRSPEQTPPCVLVSSLPCGSDDRGSTNKEQKREAVKSFPILYWKVEVHHNNVVFNQIRKLVDYSLPSLMFYFICTSEVI